MTDVAAIARQLQAAGFIVTLDLHVEAAGAAFVLNVSPKTLRNWRAEEMGPPWRIARRQAWYSIVDLIAWRGTCTSLQTSDQSAHFDVR